MSSGFETYIGFIKRKRLKLTGQRDEILSAFLKVGRHLSVDELHGIVRRGDPRIGLVTVFRTLKLLCEAGIAKEVGFDERRKRYEPCSGQEHHDHLICEQCGSITEVLEPEIERLQDMLCNKFQFTPQRHKMEIYGACRKCIKKKSRKRK